MRGIKSKTVRKLLINQYKTNAAILTTSSLGSQSCGIVRCMTRKHICHCWNIRSRVTGRTCGIIGNIDCSSTDVICVYHCLLCDKRYVCDTGSSPRLRSNGHRYVIKRKNPLSSLFSHLAEHGESDLASLCAYIIIPIAVIPRTGSAKLDLINRFRLETSWIYASCSLEPTGIKL